MSPREPSEVPGGTVGRGAPTAAAAPAWRPALIAGLALAVAVLLALHVQWMNGMLWTRAWCERALLDFLPGFLLAASPIALAVLLEHRSARADGGPGTGHSTASPAPAATVALLTLGAFLLLLAGSLLHDTEGGLAPGRLPRLIQDEYATSYWTDAVALRERPGFLAEYPALMDTLHLHSENKPPGPVLFFMAFVALFGPGELSAHASGLCLALLAALVVPATWWMVRVLTGSRAAAFAAAALAALHPGLLLGLPSIDQLVPLFTCAMVATWAIALRERSRGAAVGFGAVLSLALLFTPLVLVVGFLLASMTVLHLAPRGAGALAPTARLVGLALATVAALYGAAYLFTGYDAVAVFEEILASKHDWDPLRTRQELLGRPYWKAAISDPWEFALGAGWVIAALALLRLATLLRRRSGAASGGTRILEILALVQIALMPQLGFVRGESARLWLFLVPLLVFVAGRELETWRPRQRVVAYASLFLVLVAIYDNMLFVGG